MTSIGACIDHTGTPISTTSIPSSAMTAAIVPPPPASILPSSPVCHGIEFFSRISVISAMKSPVASEQPDLPLAPVYFSILRRFAKPFAPEEEYDVAA